MAQVKSLLNYIAMLLASKYTKTQDFKCLCSAYFSMYRTTYGL